MNLPAGPIERILTLNDTNIGSMELEVVEEWWARQDSNL